MGSKHVLLICFILASFTLFVVSEVVIEVSTPEKKSENELNDANNGLGGGGFGPGRRGYGPGDGEFGPGGGDYNRGSGNYCRWGCCHRDYFGRGCERCCRYAGERMKYIQQAGEVQPAEATSMDTETKVENKEADRYGGGRCRYGCCGYGLYGRCRRCCINANEAAAALVAEDEDQANKYVRGGGRCRYGCCGYGQFGSCRRCCMTANEAEAFQIEEKNEASDEQNLVANKDATYGGGWGGYGGGWSGGRGGGYGWGGGPGGGGYGWGGRGGGGGYGWGGGGGGHGSGYGGGKYGGGRCRYGCCGGHGYHGGCTRCCYSVQEAQSMQSEVKP